MSVSPMQVIILLATCNGEPFLAAQLDSLLAQSHGDWLLLARDDGSTDGTREVLTAYRDREPQRIVPLPAAGRRAPLGACRNFAGLLDYLLANERRLGLDRYLIAFCDQDDLWHPHRLRDSVAALNRLAGTAAPPLTERPLLTHCELRVIDADGRPLADRFSDFQGFDPRRHRFDDLLLGNVVSGCGALMTPALARLATPIPEAAVMHDWWIALVASLVGRIGYIERPLVAYRQHGANTFGAQRSRAGQSWWQRLRFLAGDAHRRQLQTVAAQAGYLLHHSPRPLSRRERLSCRLTGLLGHRRLAFRLAALQLIKLRRRAVGR